MDIDQLTPIDIPLHGLDSARHAETLLFPLASLVLGNAIHAIDLDVGWFRGVC